MEWINIISNRDARVSKININNLYVLKIEFTMLEDNTLKDMKG